MNNETHMFKVASYILVNYWAVCCQLNMVIDLFQAQYVVDDLKINNDMLGWKRMCCCCVSFGPVH